MMSIITLTTDFGLKDHFVGCLKGKLMSVLPDVKIIDISHDIDLFNIAQAGYVINASYNSFPKGTVHIIGVDSEFNIDNKHIVIEWNNHFFICADNGILSILTQKSLPKKIIEITIHNSLPQGYTDMDVFIKVAGHIVQGGKLNVIGKELNTLKTVHELQPIVNDINNIKGNVIYIDHYGNCVTNISKEIFNSVGNNRKFEIRFGSKTIKKIHSHYANFKVSDKYSLKDFEGEKLAIFNEAGFLEIAIYKSNPNTVGSASSLLGLKYRDVVMLEFLD